MTLPNETCFAVQMKTIKQKRYQKWKSNKYKNVIKNALRDTMPVHERTHNNNTKNIYKNPFCYFRPICMKLF